MSLIDRYPQEWDPLHSSTISRRKMHVHHKEGASIDDLALSLLPALYLCASIFRLRGYECVVTSTYRPGDDGRHGEREAFDLRTYHVPLYDQQELRGQIAAALGPDFDVLLEHYPPHLHVEKDPE